MSTNDLRLAVGLRSTTQSISLFAIETGQFQACGLDVTLAAMEIAGPEAASGLAEGRWAVAEFGAVPVVGSILRGGDLAIVASVEPNSALFIMSGAKISTPAQLAGGRIGVLTADGQTGVLAAKILTHWGLADAVALAPLGTYPAIYEAVRTGDIAAGVVSADYGFAGQHDADLNILIDLADTFSIQGPCVVTTRGVLRDQSDRIARFIEGYCRAIRLFKTRPEIAVPFLDAHLGFSRPVVERIYQFYATRFQACPLPSRVGIENAIREFVGPDATRQMTFDDVCDVTHLDHLRRSGCFEEGFDGSRTWR